MIENIVFNSAGFREILESEGVKDLVEQTAGEICNKANENAGFDGYEVRVQHTTMISQALQLIRHLPAPWHP